MLLKITNNVTHNTTSFTDLADIGSSMLFYTFNITLPSGLDDGEYQYELFDGNMIVASGLLQIGDYVANNKTYTAQKINGYVQYQGS